jgi:hypothetical protein
LANGIDNSHRSPRFDQDRIDLSSKYNNQFLRIDLWLLGRISKWDVSDCTTHSVIARQPWTLSLPDGFSTGGLLEVVRDIKQRIIRAREAA